MQCSTVLLGVFGGVTGAGAPAPAQFGEGGAPSAGEGLACILVFTELAPSQASWGVCRASAKLHGLIFYMKLGLGAA